MCVCVCVCVSACACLRVCVCVSTGGHTRLCEWLPHKPLAPPYADGGSGNVYTGGTDSHDSHPR